MRLLSWVNFLPEVQIFRKTFPQMIILAAVVTKILVQGLRLRCACVSVRVRGILKPPSSLMFGHCSSVYTPESLSCCCTNEALVLVK